jgi:prevent-host-death family protein
MESVGVRELKARLSHHLKRVRAGHTVTITDRGRVVARLQPVDARGETAGIMRLVSEGKISWSGGRPQGSARPVKLNGRKLASDYVIEGRR